MQSQSLEGMCVEFSWPVTPKIIRDFARITGDDHPIHVDDTAAQNAGLATTIVQGSYLVAIMANAASRFFVNARRSGLSYGYDGLRFKSPVSTTDVLLVKYEIRHHEVTTGHMRAAVSVTKANGQIAVIADHLITVFPEDKVPKAG